MLKELHQVFETPKKTGARSIHLWEFGKEINSLELRLQRDKNIPWWGSVVKAGMAAGAGC